MAAREFAVPADDGVEKHCYSDRSAASKGVRVTARIATSDANPPESYRSLAREYPLLTVAAGLGIGLLVAALLPRGFASKAGRRAMGAATVAAELGLAYSKQARDAAGEAAHDGIAKLEETTAPLRKNALRAGENARNRGVQLAEDAVKLVKRLRK